MYLPKSVYRQVVRDDDAELNRVDIYVDYDTPMDEVKTIFENIVRTHRCSTARF